MTALRRLLGVGIALSLLAWPLALAGATCCAPDPVCGMSCCRSARGAGTQAEPGHQAGHTCRARSTPDRAVSCYCNHALDSLTLTALPKITFDRSVALLTPQDGWGECPWRKSLELAGHLSVPSPPPLNPHLSLRII